MLWMVIFFIGLKKKNMWKYNCTLSLKRRYQLDQTSNNRVTCLSEINTCSYYCQTTCYKKLIKNCNVIVTSTDVYVPNIRLSIYQFTN